MVTRNSYKPETSPNTYKHHAQDYVEGVCRSDEHKTKHRQAMLLSLLLLLVVVVLVVLLIVIVATVVMRNKNSAYDTHNIRIVVLSSKAILPKN